MVEQHPVKVTVAGSSPASGAKWNHQDMKREHRTVCIE